MKFDYYLASQYSGGIYNKQEYAMVMNSNDFDIFKDKKTEKLLTYARENNFFHWELEFPEVFQKGGFDIAIGNPPYVEVKKEKYLHSVMPVGNTKNLYSYIIYRNMKHLKDGGIMSLIVLMSIISSKKMLEIRKELQKVNGKISFMNIDSATYPGTLFKGLMIRLTIISVDKNEKEKNSLYSTNYKRFFQKERYKLFKEVEYQNVKKEFINDGYIPKIGSKMDESILKKIYRKTDKTFENFITKEKTENYLYYRKVGGVYYCIAFKEAPYFKKNGKQTISSSLKKIYFKKNIPPEIPLSIFHSTLFYWFWILYSDCYNFKVSDLYRFKIDMEDFKSYFDYKSTYQKINDSLELNKKFVKYKKSFGNLEYYEYRHRESKGIFDEVDQKLADYYELTNKELNYIINYDYKYRVGD